MTLQYRVAVLLVLPLSLIHFYSWVTKIAATAVESAMILGFLTAIGIAMWRRSWETRAKVDANSAGVPTMPTTTSEAENHIRQCDSFDPYRILCVDSRASLEDIRKS